jgi:hypothetical protein
MICGPLKSAESSFCVALGLRLLAAGMARAQNHGGIRTEEDSHLYHWLLDRMLEAESIKVGTSRRIFSECSCRMVDYREFQRLVTFCAAAI